MAAPDSVIPLKDTFDHLRHFQSEQVKTGQAAEDSEGQQTHSQGAVVNDLGLPTEMTPCSVSAARCQEGSGSGYSEQSETSGIDLSVMCTAISMVCGVKKTDILLIVADLRCKGNPINYKTLVDKFTNYDTFYNKTYTEGSEEECEESMTAYGASSNPSLTTTSQLLPSSAHASEHSSPRSDNHQQLNSTTHKSPSDNHQQMNSTTHKSPSTNSNNSNTNNKQSSFHNSMHSLSSSPTIPRDYKYQDSTQGELYNAAENVGEDSTDGHISNDGLDRWLANDFSNPHVQISDSSLEYSGSQVLSQTLTGSGHNMAANKPGQSMLIHELINEKPTVTSRDGLTVSQDLPDIVCDGPEKSHQADQRRNIHGAKSRSIKKSRTLTEAEIFQICFGLLEKEHEILTKSRLCHSCHEKPREVTFLPCGHFITCGECAEPIYVCPLCEKSVLATINTFLS